jgi:DNA-binding MarR family transcriptional regulator
MLQTHARTLRRLDDELLHAHRLSVSEFDVLITLDNAPDRELRMTDLALAVMLSPSGLTRMVGRLEQAGLVERRRSADDARSFRAALTDAGAARLLEARATHNAVIRDLVLDRLSPAEHQALARTWEKLAAG